MSEKALLASLIKADKKALMPLFSFTWITFALFEISIPNIVTISVATEGSEMPLYVAVGFTLIWVAMQYKPPPERREKTSRAYNVVVSPVTRNLATRIIGKIAHNGKANWMLFEEALGMRTEHHELKPKEKDEKITGLQLDCTTFAGLTERAVRDEDGRTLIRSIYADDMTVMQ